jgi:hypothetical protein
MLLLKHDKVIILQGANFRNLKGIIIKEDGTVDVEREPREYLASGKPLVSLLRCSKLEKGNCVRTLYSSKS